MARPDPAFGAFVRQAMTAQDPTTVFTSTDGLEYHTELDPEPTIRRRVRPIGAPPGSGVEVIDWTPSEVRPPLYPPETPFVPGATILTMERRTPHTFRMVSFKSTGGLAQLLQDLLAEARDTGWTEIPLRADWPTIVEGVHHLERDAMSRMLIPPGAMGGEPAVVMIEAPTQPDGRGQAA